MIDQKQANNISKVIGAVFIFFGIVMLILGIPFIMINNRNNVENTIMILSLISGVLMLVGGYQNIKKAKNKDVAINLYEDQVRQQLKAFQNSAISNSASNKEIGPSDPSVEYRPDVLATWNYTREEWKLMTSEETKRRLKEGITVTLGIGVLGAVVLYFYRGVGFLAGFIGSLCLGVLISLMKVLLAANLFRIRKKNVIILTTNALIINGKFKTLHDDHIKLEYVKAIESGEHNFIEFSLQWPTRSGTTNDQIRICVPPHYEKDISKVLDYYNAKGVRTCD